MTPSEVYSKRSWSQLQAKHRERAERSAASFDGYYGRGLTTTTGHIEQIRVPSAREMPFLTEVFERNVLAHVPQAEAKAVASDLKVVFQSACRETAEGLVASFAECYREVYPKAGVALTRGLDEALTFTTFLRAIPGWSGSSGGQAAHARGRRPPSEQSAETLATAILLRVSEDWPLHRYLDTEPLHVLFHEPTGFAT